MRTSQHWLSRLLECTQSLCQHQNSWKGWGWVGGALRDGGWEWGRGGESGRGGFARTVVGAPAVGAAYRSCVVQLVLGWEHIFDTRKWFFGHFIYFAYFGPVFRV